jgi:hypothetical protein
VPLQWPDVERGRADEPTEGARLRDRRGRPEPLGLLRGVVVGRIPIDPRRLLPSYVSARPKLMLPPASPTGSITNVYVPVAGSTAETAVPPEVSQ